MLQGILRHTQAVLSLTAIAQSAVGTATNPESHGSLACFQQTGGQLAIITGGHLAINVVVNSTILLLITEQQPSLQLVAGQEHSL